MLFGELVERAGVVVAQRRQLFERRPGVAVGLVDRRLLESLGLGFGERALAVRSSDQVVNALCVMSSAFASFLIRPAPPKWSGCEWVTTTVWMSFTP